ncbi:MAG TPA: hypothetical protein VGP82_20225 [Ktedonobacterales bacterium]|jgi:DNA-binding response OmpR family regulator|nr:hypothetical protein [Ktedonobacterales bacterium]
MTSALVVETNPELGESIVDILRDERFAATWTGNYDVALAALQLSPMPLIVLLGHGGRSALSMRLLQQIAVLPTHNYVLVSTRAAAAPYIWNPRTARRVPILSAPFDIDDLATQVRTMAAELVERTFRLSRGHDEAIRRQGTTGWQGAAPALEDHCAAHTQPTETAGEVSSVPHG